MTGSGLSIAQETDQRVLERIRDLEDRVQQLYRMHPRPAVGGAVGAGAAPDGTVQLEPTKAWFRVNGVWRFAALT